jgi:hypothetical protein
MSDQVLVGTLEVGRLQAIVGSLRPRARFGILERLDAIDFPPPQADAVEVARWPKGRIFDQAFELRWEQLGQAYRAVLATETTDILPVAGLSEHALNFDAIESQAYYCWNERNARLGRTLGYRCAPGKGPLQLVVREYRDAHWRLVFWRYVELRRQEETQ